MKLESLKALLLALSPSMCFHEMTLHRFHYNQEMPTVSVMETHKKTLAECVPADPNMHSPFQETLGKKKVWTHEPDTSTKLGTQVASSVY